MNTPFTVFCCAILLLAAGWLFRDRVAPPRTILKKVAIIAALITGIGAYMIFLHLTEYHRFRKQSESYYKELIKACDLILAQHPLGTNKIIEVPVTDKRIPGTIRKLHPLRIKVMPNCLWILHGGSIKFGIIWMQDDNRTNIWRLSTSCESHARNIYLVER